MQQFNSFIVAVVLAIALVQQQAMAGLSFKLVVASITTGGAGSNCIDMTNPQTTFFSGTGCQELPQPDGTALSVKSVLFGCGSENSTITLFGESGCATGTEVDTWTTVASMLMCRYNLDGAVEVKCGVRGDSGNGTTSTGSPTIVGGGGVASLSPTFEGEASASPSISGASASPSIAGASGSPTFAYGTGSPTSVGATAAPGIGASSLSPTSSSSFLTISTFLAMIAVIVSSMVMF